MKLFVKIVNGLALFIFVTKSPNFDIVVGLDTSLIVVNYKIVFYYF